MKAKTILGRTLTSVRLTRLLRDFCSKAGVPGVAVSLSVAGKNIHASAGVRDAGDRRSYMDEGSVFCFNDVTRLMVIGVVLDMARSGQLQLHRPIWEYLPELFGPNRNATVSLAHLVSHSSGLIGPNPADMDVSFEPWPSLASFFRRTRQLFAPGSVFNRIDSADAIVDRLAGCGSLPLDRLVNEMYGGPLGLDRNGTADLVAGHSLEGAKASPHAIEARPTGGSFFVQRATKTSVKQLAQLARMVVCGSCAPAIRPEIMAQSIALPEMLRPRVHEDVPRAFGLGIAEYAPGVFGISGATAGQCFAVRVLPDLETSLAVAMNVDAPGVRDLIVRRVLHDVTGTTLSEPKAALTLDHPVGELVGRYEAAHDWTLSVSMERNETLRIVRDPNPWLPSEFTSLAPILLDIKDTRTVTLKDYSRPIAIGFLREPTGSDLCVMIGPHTFRRVAGVGP